MGLLSRCSFSRTPLRPTLPSPCRALFQRVAHAWLALGAGPRFSGPRGSSRTRTGDCKSKQKFQMSSSGWMSERAYENIILLLFFFSFPPCSHSEHEQPRKSLNLHLGGERQLKPGPFISFQRGRLGAFGGRAELKHRVSGYDSSLEGVMGVFMDVVVRMRMRISKAPSI